MSDSKRAQHGLHRRDLLKTSLGAIGGGVLAGAVGAPPAEAGQVEDPERGSPIPKEVEVILFQGDSITDAGRRRDAASKANEQPGLGNGYAWLAAAPLLVHQPDAGLKIYNRGISGNKVFQLAERWDSDCLELKPDLLSVLIGVNDIWHGLNGSYDGTVEVYERDYDALLERTRKSLPKVKLVICEPFVLRCGAVNGKWFPLFDEYRAAARRIASAFGAVWVPFQSIFDEAVKYAPPEHWAGDGVHPSAAGASLMAYSWLRAVGA